MLRSDEAATAKSLPMFHVMSAGPLMLLLLWWATLFRYTAFPNKIPCGCCFVAKIPTTGDDVGCATDGGLSRFRLRTVKIQKRLVAKMTKVYITCSTLPSSKLLCSW